MLFQQPSQWTGLGSASENHPTDDMVPSGVREEKVCILTHPLTFPYVHPAKCGVLKHFSMYTLLTYAYIGHSHEHNTPELSVRGGFSPLTKQDFELSVETL